MKKLIASLLCAILLLGLLPVAAEKAEPTVSGDYEYVLLEDGTAQITKYTGDAVTLEIAGELDGHAVSSIGKSAFKPTGKLVDVTIPEGVTEICDGAFSYLLDLRSVKIPDSVTTVENDPFQNCLTLYSIEVSPDHPVLETVGGALYSKAEQRLICYPPVLPDKTYEIKPGTVIIDNRAFSTAPYLVEVYFPDSVTTIANSMFVNCAFLESITVSPENPVLESMDGILFVKEGHQLYCCPEHKNGEIYEIPQGTESIGEYAFRFCSFKEVIIPDSVTAINKNAFRGCAKLLTVTIPDSVTSIPDNVFRNCENLASAIIPASVTEISKNAFTGCDKIVFTVPAGSYAEQYCKENSLNYVLADN